MKLEITLYEAAIASRALYFETKSAEKNVLECAKLGLDDVAEAWKERASDYRKVYEKIEAQLQQAIEEYKRTKEYKRTIAAVRKKGKKAASDMA